MSLSPAEPISITTAVLPKPNLSQSLKPKSTTKTKPGPKPKGERPTKYLPTPRIAFSKQLDILRAWGAASGPSSKVVSNGAVAQIVRMNDSTISLANPFFSSVGLLTKTDGGYIPCLEVMNFLRVFEWSPSTAAHKMAPIFAKTWFAEELLSKLDFGPIPEKDAIQDLAEAASASPEYRGQLEMLLDYLNEVNLIQRDGGQIKKPVTIVSAMPISDDMPNSRLESAAPSESVRKSPTPSLFGTTEGTVNFNVSVRVDMAELANWKPERIAAFFNGIAGVLAAKADVEKKTP